MTSGRRQLDEIVVDLPSTRDAVMALVSAGLRIWETYNAALHPHGITLDQCRILQELRHAGPRGLDSEAFHRALRRIGAVHLDEGRLENVGWLTRDRDGVRRITDPGRRLIAELDPTLEEVEDRLSEALGSDELEELLRILGKFVD